MRVIGAFSAHTEKIGILPRAELTVFACLQLCAVTTTTCPLHLLTTATVNYVAAYNLSRLYMGICQVTSRKTTEAKIHRLVGLLALTYVIPAWYRLVMAKPNPDLDPGNYWLSSLVLLEQSHYWAAAFCGLVSYLGGTIMLRMLNGKLSIMTLRTITLALFMGLFNHLLLFLHVTFELHEKTGNILRCMLRSIGWVMGFLWAFTIFRWWTASLFSRPSAPRTQTHSSGSSPVTDFFVNTWLHMDTDKEASDSRPRYLFRDPSKLAIHSSVAIFLVAPMPLMVSMVERLAVSTDLPGIGPADSHDPMVASYVRATFGLLYGMSLSAMFDFTLAIQKLLSLPRLVFAVITTPIAAVFGPVVLAQFVMSDESYSTYQLYLQQLTGLTFPSIVTASE